MVAVRRVSVDNSPLDNASLNGIATSTDGKTIYVTFTGPGRVRAASSRCRRSDLRRKCAKRLNGCGLGLTCVAARTGMGQLALSHDGTGSQANVGSWHIG